MKSRLIVVPVSRLLQDVVDVVLSIDGAVIYVSLNKSVETMKKFFVKKRDGLEIFFIDCVSHDKKFDDVLYIDPMELEKLNCAIESFKNEIVGKKIIVFDALSTLLIYNNENKVAGFVKRIVGFSNDDDVDVLAFTPKTRGEELLIKIFNFFDEVKQK